jgi:hypothetical protein
MQTLTGIIPLSPKIDPTLDGEGWNEVIAEIKADGIDKDRVFLFTHKYYTGGKLAYAAGDDYTVTVLYDDPHIFAFTVDQKKLIGKDAIMVTQQQRYPRQAEKIYGDYFREIDFYKEKTTTRATGKPAQTYRLFYCHEFIKPYLARYL